MISWQEQGVLCVLGREPAKQVFAARDQQTLIAAVNQLIEAADAAACANCQGCWQTLQQCFSVDSAESEGPGVLAECVAGGRQLQRAPGSIVSMVRPDLVPHIADQLEVMDEQRFLRLVDRVGATNVSELWPIVLDVARVYRRAADEKSAMIFAAAAPLPST